MYTGVYNSWLENTIENEEIYSELKSINGKEKEIEDRFYKELDFGTAGLRGVIGAGTNRMNIYTVGKATQGLAQFLLGSCKHTPKVAIAYDSRKNSLLFAEYSASVLGANGIKVFLYKTLMPTPMLSYAVRALGCDSGIVITASHNPAQYNGYKVYGSSGFQITDHDAAAITGFIKKTDIWNDVKYESLSDLLEREIVQYISQDVIEDYYNEIYKCKVTPDDLSNINIVYTPLNGTGNIPVRTVLNHYNIGTINIVKEQENPDATFATCVYPNPENIDAIQLGLKLSKITKSDILLSTDPDCDRCGVAVRHGCDYIQLTGNQIGVLMLNFICSVKGDAVKNGTAVKSIVSTELASCIANDYGIKLKNVLVGFKYIGEIITNLEDEGRADEFVLGFEESCGYLSGIHSRDKDAVNASLLICEMTSFYKKQGKDLIDVLNDIYAKYGFYLDKVDNYQFEGVEGEKKMKEMIAIINEKSNIDDCGYKTLFMENYSKSIRVENGFVSKLDLPVSNVIRFGLNDGTAITVRPSGTEPKIKLYYSIKAQDENAANEKYYVFQKYMKGIMGIE